MPVFWWGCRGYKRPGGVDIFWLLGFGSEQHMEILLMNNFLSVRYQIVVR